MPHVESLEDRRLFAFGSLDTTFGPDGHVWPLPLTEYVRTQKTIVQSDGRILIGGGLSSWELRRYLPDGSIDNSFGQGGLRRMTEVNPFGGRIEFLAETIDNKIFVGGYAHPEWEMDSGNIATSMLIARLNFDGSLDETFLPDAASTVGRPGFMRVDAIIAGWSRFRQQLVKVDAAGRLLVATGDTPAELTLSRYTPDGQLDPSFGVGGRVSNVSLAIPTDPIAPPGKKTMTFRGASGLRSLALAPDGSIVGMGYYTYGRGTASYPDFVRADIPFFVRFSPDGQVSSTLVYSLDINKAQGTRYTGFQVVPFTMEVAANGKIYLTGDQVLARLNPDFLLDTSFSADGVVSPSAVVDGTTFSASFSDLKVQADGKAVGVVRDSANSVQIREAILIRLNDDGSTEHSVQLDIPPDPTPFDLFGGTLNQLELANDGTILVAGEMFPLTRVFRDEGPAGRFDGGSVTTSAQAARVYKFGIVWRDDGGVAIDSIDNGDLQILTPAGGRMIAQLISKTTQLDGSVVARYRTGPPNGVAWTAADDGRYVVRLLSNRVADVAGGPAAGRTLGTFVVRVPEPTAATSARLREPLLRSAHSHDASQRSAWEQLTDSP